jgi:folate-binding protein YgfZ
VPASPARSVRPGDAFVIGRGGGVDVVGPVGAVDDIHRRAGRRRRRRATPTTSRPGGSPPGVPAWGSEVVAPHLPEEVGLLPTHVHLAKGCYPGQEAVARMWMLGRPRRRLAVVTAATARSRSAGRPGRAQGGHRHLGVPRRGAGAFAATPPGGDARRGGPLVGDDAHPPGHDPAVTGAATSRRSSRLADEAPGRGAVCRGTIQADQHAPSRRRGARLTRSRGSIRDLRPWRAAGYRRGSAVEVGDGGSTCVGVLLRLDLRPHRGDVAVASIRTVERITPSYSLPYIFFTPQAP